MAITYTVTVLKRNIARDYLPGGQGWRWMDRVRLKMHAACVKDAPSRTGNLAGSHRSFARGFGGNRVDVRVLNTADHAEWVHEGTNGASAPEDWLYIPAGGPGRNTVSPYAGNFYSKGRYRYVRGQLSNPWLENACSRVARQNGALEIG